MAITARRNRLHKKEPIAASQQPRRTTTSVQPPRQRNCFSRAQRAARRHCQRNERLDVARQLRTRPQQQEGLRVGPGQLVLNEPKKLRSLDKPVARGHHRAYRSPRTLQADGAADHFGLRFKTLAPQSIAQRHATLRARLDRAKCGIFCDANPSWSSESCSRTSRSTRESRERRSHGHRSAGSRVPRSDR